jgi:hypothetical protein
MFYETQFAESLVEIWDQEYPEQMSQLRQRGGRRFKKFVDDAACDAAKYYAETIVKGNMSALEVLDVALTLIKPRIRDLRLTSNG